MTECLAMECNRDARIKGMCNMHYQRFKRHGSFTIVLRQKNTYKECTIDRCHNKLYRDYRCLEHYRYRGKHCED